MADFDIKRTLSVSGIANGCVAVAVLVAYTVILACLIGMKVNVCLGAGLVGLCRRT